MRYIWITLVLLGVMAAVDGYFSVCLSAELHELADTAPVMMAVQAVGEQPVIDLHSVSLVDAALNSRYMQWGAVGLIMLQLIYQKIIVDPRQEIAREAAINRIVDVFSMTLKERDSVFTETLRQHDDQYVLMISEIRQSAERHTDRVVESKEKMAASFSELSAVIRGTRTSVEC